MIPVSDKPEALRRPAWAGPAGALLLVALAALLPRTVGLRDFLTTDEAYHWITRTERFAAAVAEGRWADTNLTGHPGVTLMWLGGLGLRLEGLATGMGWAAAPDELGHLAWLRLGPALAHGLLIPLGYLLLRRLLRPRAALLAALLWATSPYLVAHGRLLHLDALLADLCTLALLAAIVAARAPRPLPWLLAGGLLTGLALLTKGPALIALPAVGLALFFGGQKSEADRLLAFFARRLIWAVPRYLIWLAVAGLTAWLLWPALWAAPQAAVGRYAEEIVGNGGRPNGDGQFFMGRAAADPGPLFYLVAGLYRLTPVELAGLLLLLMIRDWRLEIGDWRLEIGDSSANPQSPIANRQSPILNRQSSIPNRQSPIPNPQSPIPNPQSPIPNPQSLAIILIGFIILWTLVMTLGPKKFDRYTLPTWPALLTLSAIGLDGLFERIRRAASDRRPARVGAQGAAIGYRLSAIGYPLLALLLQGAVLAWYHPYYLSYYSPLLGGGAAAERTFLIGWGEGMDQAGAWLSAQPDIGAGQVLAALAPTLRPFVPVPVQAVRAIDSLSANYAVVYLESVQRGDAPEIYARIRETVPLHTVRIHGITYAWVHQLARPFSTPVGAQFGDGLRLRGFSAEQQGARLIVTPAWDVRGPVGGDYQLFLHVYDAAGARVAQIDVAPGGASAPPTGQWRPGAQIAVPLPIDLPADLPAGEYRLALGLYAPAGFARLPLAAGPAFDAAIAGPDAALLGSVVLERPHD